MREVDQALARAYQWSVAGSPGVPPPRTCRRGSEVAIGPETVHTARSLGPGNPASTANAASGPAPVAGDHPRRSSASSANGSSSLADTLLGDPRPAAPQGPALHELPPRRGPDDPGPDPGPGPGPSAGPDPAGRRRPDRPDAGPAAGLAARGRARRRDRRGLRASPTP